MQKGHNLETMLRILKGFMTDMETDLSAFLESDNLQDAKAIADIANESISETITLFKAIRNIASIPSQLFLHKFERYCKGLGNIPKEKREKYIQMLGKEKFNRRCMLIARTFKSSLLQRWSAHLWQNEMTKVRKFHIMSCIAIY